MFHFRVIVEGVSGFVALGLNHGRELGFAFGGFRSSTRVELYWTRYSAMSLRLSSKVDFPRRFFIFVFIY